MTNQVNAFLQSYFKDLELKPPLFYSWNYGLRFEIADPIKWNEKGGMSQAYERSTTLFNEVFAIDDNIIFVTDVHTFKSNKYLQKRPLNVYSKFIKSKQKLYQLSHQTLPELEEEDGVTHRFSLICNKSEIRYASLLKAICHEDMGDSQTILRGDRRIGYNIYLINDTKQIIYHLYDDRGCDIIAAGQRSLHAIYKNYNHWLLDYDREKMASLFAQSNM
ncbi:DUF3885 domain-containing protein [Niallia taxi]|uniref:DUF3885 domain-containing protein n=1 Tax=Niallia taxi TaxID=2499688 RepID=UPI00316C069E